MNSNKIIENTTSPQKYSFMKLSNLNQNSVISLCSPSENQVKLSEINNESSNNLLHINTPFE